MKKCPFCAEEIQEEAIKCRFCSSWLSKDRGGSAAPAPAPAGTSGSPARLRPSVDTAGAGTPSGAKGPRLLAQGIPSWKAYFRHYAGVAVLAIVAPTAGHLIAVQTGAAVLAHVLAIAVLLLLAGLAYLVLGWYRRSRRYRVTTNYIETEYGLLSKRIDNLELWRCRDVRFHQSLLDRILHIAHLHIYTHDVTTPQVILRGMPSSRKIFEDVREAIEIQRQARNVIGLAE